MTDLERQVARVWRRLNLQRFLNILVWSWAGALAVAVVWLLAEKLWHPVLEPWWLTTLLHLGAGTVVAAAVWAATRHSRLEAALMLDRAFGLKERVSTALTIPDQLRHTPAGLALVNDTVRRVQGLEISDGFKLRLPRTAWVPLVPAALAFLVATFVGPLGRSSTAEADSELSKQQQQIQRSTTVLKRQLEERKKLAKKQGLKEVAGLLEELEQKAARDIADAKDIDRKKALAKLHQLQKTLQERRERLGSAEQLQRQLAKMQTVASKGPADQFIRALKKGDFQKAAKALERLAQQLKQGKLDPARKQQLAKQLEQLRKELRKLADLQQRRQQLQQAGLPPDVLKQELAKLDAQAKQFELLQKLAEKLGACQQALQKGDLQAAAESLQLSQGELDQITEQLQQMQMLEQILDDFDQMRRAMACDNCGGLGCRLCRRPGVGMGPGRGTGPRPEEKDQTRSFNVRAPQKRQPGKIQVLGFTRGGQTKGNSQLQVEQALEAGRAEAARALSKQRIPREYTRHAKEYFEKVAGRR